MRIIKTRKIHKCRMCGQEIPIGLAFLVYADAVTYALRKYHHKLCGLELFRGMTEQLKATK